MRFCLFIAVLSLSLSCFSGWAGESVLAPDRIWYQADFKATLKDWSPFQGGEVKCVAADNGPLPDDPCCILQVEGRDNVIGVIRNGLDITADERTVVEFDWKSVCEASVKYVAFSFSVDGGREPLWLFSDNRDNAIMNPVLGKWHHAKLRLIDFKSANGRLHIRKGDKVLAFGICEAQTDGVSHKLSVANFKIYDTAADVQASTPEEWSNNCPLEANPEGAYPLVSPPCLSKREGTSGDAFRLLAAEIPTLPNKPGGKLTEITNFRVAYDNDNLYVWAEVGQSYLDPVFNKLDRIKPKAVKRDGPVYEDDSIEVYLLPNGNDCYQFAVNMDGTLFDSKNKNPKWNSNAKVSTSRKDRWWTVEMAIPFADLGVSGEMDGKTWRANFYRNNPLKREDSAWSPTGRWFNTVECFGYVSFSPSAPLIQCGRMDLKPEGSTLDFRVSTKDALSASGATEPISVTAGDTCKTGVSLKPDSRGYGQLRVTRDRDKAEIFRTPAVPISAKKAELLAELSGPGNAIELLLNGKVVAAAKDKMKACVFIEGEMNLLALKVTGPAAAVTGNFSVGGISFPLTTWLCSSKEAPGWSAVDFADGEWKFHAGEKAAGQTLFRHYLLRNHTKFAPQLEKNTVYVANGAALFAGIQRSSPFEKRVVENYTVHLSLPEGMKIPLYEPEKRSWYKYKENKHSLAVKNNDGMTEFTFSYENPIPKLNYVGGVFNINLVIAPEFPEAMAGKTLKGRCHITGRGLHELPNDFNIKILPALKGVQPKGIILKACFNTPGQRLSLRETERLLPAMRRMGGQFAELDCLCFGSADGRLTSEETFSDINHFVSAAHAEGIKTLYLLFGGNDTALTRDVCLAHPELMSVKLTPQKEWERNMCPLAYMSSPDIADRIKRLAKINDRVMFDAENGIAGVCFCQRCMKRIVKELNLSEDASPNDIVAKHKDTLVKYQLDVNRMMFDFIKNTAKAANPDVKCDIYTSHTIDAIAEAYGMKWEIYKDVVDMPWAGYGEGRQLFRRTRSSLGGRPLVGGFMLDTGYFKEPYDSQNIKSRLFAQLINSGFGGVFIWTYEELNGVGQTAFAELARGVAAYEEFLVESNEIPNAGIVKGTGEDDVHIYRKGGQYLCVVNNLLGSEKTITVTCPEGACDVFDYYADMHMAPGRGLEFKVSPYDTLLLRIK